jgi:hypothetical protein
VRTGASSRGAARSRIELGVAPCEAHPDFTQEVAPNDSQTAPKATTREGLIYETLLGARWRRRFKSDPGKPPRSAPRLNGCPCATRRRGRPRRPSRASELEKLTSLHHCSWSGSRASASGGVSPVRLAAATAWPAQRALTLEPARRRRSTRASLGAHANIANTRQDTSHCRRTASSARSAAGAPAVPSPAR